MRKVNIIGKGTGWWDAPMDEEAWGVNDLSLLRDDLSLVFDLHDLDLSLDANFREERFVRAFKSNVKKINERKTPIMLQKKHKIFPHGIVFPLDEMPFKYFTSSIPYMIAYAIHQKVDSIHIYGLPIHLEGEYHYQRPCIEFWLGYAIGKGIDVTIHQPSHLLSSVPHYGLYAYEWIYRKSEGTYVNPQIDQGDYAKKQYSQ